MDCKNIEGGKGEGSARGFLYISLIGGSGLIATPYIAKTLLRSRISKLVSWSAICSKKVKLGSMN